MLFMADQTKTSTADTRQSCGLCCTRLADFGVKLGNVPIIEKVNLHVHCGELTVFVGPNGAGKTTLLKAILGEIPHSGKLHFIRSNKKHDGNRPRIGYVPQKFALDVSSPVSVTDLFAMALSNWPVWLGHRRVISETTARMLAVVQSEHLAAKRLGELSTGQLQRILLALALTPTPELLLLDEPTSGMDPRGAALFYRTISRLRHDFDLSIILVSHDLTVAARFADRMIFLNRTIVCDGVPKKVLADKRLLETMGLDFPAPESLPDGNFAVFNSRHAECDTRFSGQYPEEGP
jgi:zinc transport system ATP-binding protein